MSAPALTESRPVVGDVVALIWTRDDTRNGQRWTLAAPGFRSPYRQDSNIGHVSHWGGHDWRGEAQTGWPEYQCISIRARSRVGAMRDLQAEIDRRSIGLFGRDQVAFTLNP